MSHRAEILLVGDSRPNLMTLGNILSGLDVNLTTSIYGLEAIAEVIKRDVAVAIVDVQSANSGGIEVVRQLKVHSLNRELPIILMTTIEELMEEGYATGAVDYLIKPFDAFVLTSKVRYFAEMHLARAALRESTDNLASEVYELKKTTEIQRKNENLLRQANKELRMLASRDPLTGMLNRREGIQILNREMSRVRRFNGDSVARLTVLMVDVDHFKDINDMHGHFVGDAVLVEITRRLQVACRTYDRLIRWGGEELLVVCPDTSSADSLRMGERFRQAISGAPFNLPEVGILQVTASFGAACTDEFPGCSVKELVHFADIALYRAKSDGRDCVRKSTPPLPAPNG